VKRRATWGTTGRRNEEKDGPLKTARLICCGGPPRWFPSTCACAGSRKGCVGTAWKTWARGPPPRRWVCARRYGTLPLSRVERRLFAHTPTDTFGVIVSALHRGHARVDIFRRHVATRPVRFQTRHASVANREPGGTASRVPEGCDSGAVSEQARRRCALRACFPNQAARRFTCNPLFDC
jgi:hypothetical protein